VFWYIDHSFLFTVFTSLGLLDWNASTERMMLSAVMLYGEVDVLKRSSRLTEYDFSIPLLVKKTNKWAVWATIKVHLYDQVVKATVGNGYQERHRETASTFILLSSHYSPRFILDREILRLSESLNPSQLQYNSIQILHLSDWVSWNWVENLIILSFISYNNKGRERLQNMI
jgi:hypothetical protein